MDFHDVKRGLHHDSPWFTTRNWGFGALRYLKIRNSTRLNMVKLINLVRSSLSILLKQHPFNHSPWDSDTGMTVGKIRVISQSWAKCWGPSSPQPPRVGPDIWALEISTNALPMCTGHKVKPYQTVLYLKTYETPYNCN
jgi:hypothetical protein